MSLLVIAEDISNRPNEIPISKWLTKGQEYNVVSTIKCNTQGGEYGYVLEEIDLTGCEPYICFATRRFRIPTPDKKEEIEKLMEI